MVLGMVLILIGVAAAPLVPFVLRCRRSRSLAPLADAGLAMLAGAAAGVVWAAGARVAMRLIALADGERTEFTVGGTLFIILTGAVLGAVLGPVYAAVHDRLPGTTAARGVIFGAMPLALQLELIAAFAPPRPSLGGTVAAVSFGALFLVFGLVLALIADRLQRLRRRAQREGASGECLDLTLPAADVVLS